MTRMTMTMRRSAVMTMKMKPITLNNKSRSVARARRRCPTPLPIQISEKIIRMPSCILKQARRAIPCRMTLKMTELAVMAIMTTMMKIKAKIRTRRTMIVKTKILMERIGKGIRGRIRRGQQHKPSTQMRAWQAHQVWSATN